MIVKIAYKSMAAGQVYYNCSVVSVFCVCVCFCVKANVCYCDSEGFDLVAFYMLCWLCVAILQKCIYSKVCALQYYITKNPIISDHVHCPLEFRISRVIDNQKVVDL